MKANDLVKLHRRVIKALQTKSRVNALWLKQLKEALLYEDIQLNLEFNNKNKVWRPKFSGCRFLNHAKIDYYWYCHFRPLAYMFVFYSLCLASFLVIWSECTFFIQDYSISIFAKLVDWFDELNAYLFVELLNTFIVSYLALCTYYTLFSIKFFNIFYIAPNQLTDANSLLFLGIMLCRLTASISLNVLGMIHMDFHIFDHTSNSRRLHETQFTKLMGHLDILEPLRARFYMYFPCLIMLITISTYKKLGTKCINYIGFFQFLETSESGSRDNFTNDIIAMGKALVQMEKSKISEDPGILSRGEHTRANSHNHSNSNDHTSINMKSPGLGSSSSTSFWSKSNTKQYQRLDQTESNSLLDKNGNNNLAYHNHNEGLSSPSTSYKNIGRQNSKNSRGSSRTTSPVGNLGRGISSGTRLFDDI